jgi:sensor histidine kinase regulating citrate/malate metabolism
VNSEPENFYLKANEYKMRAALYNLATNSLDAESNIIGFSVHDCNTNRFRISVEDNGTGIEEEAKHKLFTEGFTTKKYGNGIGLNNVLEFVKSVNGCVNFKSKKDE